MLILAALQGVLFSVHYSHESKIETDMSERDSDKKPEAKRAHTPFLASHYAAFLHYLLISHVTHMLYLLFLPSPVSLQVFLSRLSERQSLSLSESEEAG